MGTHPSTVCHLTLIRPRDILDLGLLVMGDILPAMALLRPTSHRTCRRSQVRHSAWIRTDRWDGRRSANDHVVGMVAVEMGGMADLHRQQVEATEVVACHTARGEV